MRSYVGIDGGRKFGPKLRTECLDVSLFGFAAPGHCAAAISSATKMQHRLVAVVGPRSRQIGRLQTTLVATRLLNATLPEGEFDGLHTRICRADGAGPFKRICSCS